MTVRCVISTDVRRRLGRAGLAELERVLWPVDCQSCGAALGGATPTLAVDQYTAEQARASLHHPGCRASGWDEDAGIATVLGGRLLTYRAQGLFMPGLGAAVLVNPGLEAQVLHRDGDRWFVPTNAGAYASLGMCPAHDYQPGTATPCLLYTSDAADE